MPSNTDAEPDTIQVVWDMEPDEPTIVGEYVQTVEDVVQYRLFGNEACRDFHLTRYAPLDCVEITTVRVPERA